MVRKSLKIAGTGVATECCPTKPLRKSKATKAFGQLFKALGDETRLEILGMLASNGAELCVCDIESHFALSQPTISHHLRLLREARLISGERRGNWIYYSLTRETLTRLADFRALFDS